MADSLSKAVAALTTKRARVQAVSTWIRAHGADAQLAERALQALLDHVAARLFADEGPAVERFKAGIATLYVIDDALKGGQEAAASDAQRAARGFADACERTRHVARLVRNLARFVEEEAGDEPRLVDVGAGVARLIAIWAARRTLREETLAADQGIFGTSARRGEAASAAGARNAAPGVWGQRVASGRALPLCAGREGDDEVEAGRRQGGP